MQGDLILLDYTHIISVSTANSVDLLPVLYHYTVFAITSYIEQRNVRFLEMVDQSFQNPLFIVIGALGGVMVKALRPKPAGRGFDSRWCHWNFSVT